MGFLERLLRGATGGHGGGHHGDKRGHGYGGHGKHGGGYYQPEPTMPTSGGQPPAQMGMKCGRCYAENAAGAKFCSGCGAQLMASTCQGCGTSLEPGVRYCNQCGKSAS